MQIYKCCHRGAALISLAEIRCGYETRRRSPPPQGGERASSAVSLVFPPHALTPSASYVVSHWLTAASGCPVKHTVESTDTLVHLNTVPKWSWYLLTPEFHRWVCSPLLAPWPLQTLCFPTWRSVSVFSGARGWDTSWGWVLLGPAVMAEGGWLLGLQRKAGVHLSGYHCGPAEALSGGWQGSLGSSLWCYQAGRGKGILLNLHNVYNYFTKGKQKNELC